VPPDSPVASSRRERRACLRDHWLPAKRALLDVRYVSATCHRLREPPFPIPLLRCCRRRCVLEGWPVAFAERSFCPGSGRRLPREWPGQRPVRGGLLTLKNWAARARVGRCPNDRCFGPRTHALDPEATSVSLVAMPESGLSCSRGAQDGFRPIAEVVIAELSAENRTFSGFGAETSVPGPGFEMER